MSESNVTEAMIEAWEAWLQTAGWSITDIRGTFMSGYRAALAHPGQVREIAIKPLTEALAFYAEAANWEYGHFVEDEPNTLTLVSSTIDQDRGDKARSALALPLPVQESVPEGMKLEITKEWFEKRVAQEGDLEIGAGKRLTSTLNLTADEIATFERLAFESLPAWAQKELAELRALSPSPSIPEEKGGTAESVGGWRPVNTAPKNTKVLAAYQNELGNWRIVTACYHTQLDWSDEYGDHEEEFAPEAWYEENDSSDVIYQTSRTPTHWMPLPSSPTEGQTVKEEETDE